MANTLTYDSTTIVLADDALWVDEFDWLPAEQEQRRSVTGKLLIEAMARTKGRPITLMADAGFAWVSLETLQALYAAAAEPGRVFELEYRGVTRNVQFDLKGRAIEAAPIVDYFDPDGTDSYAVTLRFIEV